MTITHNKTSRGECTNDCHGLSRFSIRTVTRYKCTLYKYEFASYRNHHLTQTSQSVDWLATFKIGKTGAIKLISFLNEFFVMKDHDYEF